MYIIAADKSPESLSAIRGDYFTFFNNNGVKYPASGDRSKPIIGRLSPGCQTCIAGTWACIYITGDCTRDCFYCPTPQKESERHKQPTVPDNLSFASVSHCIEYLNTFDFEGVAFSGGEPLLTLDRVLEYTKAIRQSFGNRHYIWAYTNGDPVTEHTLARLQEAGLNELRFDIAANNYDLRAVETAVDYIDTVSVEIPAIPEDLELLKSILQEMEHIGVKHLNLHQLMKTEHNAEKLNQRGYSTVNDHIYPNYTPIVESEFAAFEVLKHAIDMKSNMGINYCSRCYKARFQGMGNRKRAAMVCQDHKPDVTETGYMRHVAIDASTEEAAMIQRHVHETEWDIMGEGEHAELVFPLQYFNVLLTETYQKADILYYEPLLLPVNHEAPAEVLSERLAGNTVCVQKNVKFRKTLDNIMSAFLFYKLFIEEKHIEMVAKELLHTYGFHEENGGEIIHDIHEFYQGFQDAEYFSHDLEPYYSIRLAGRCTMLSSDSIPKPVSGLNIETFGEGVLVYHETIREAVHLNNSAAV